MNHDIVLIPVGEVEPAVLTHLGTALIKVFGRPCQVGRALPTPTYAFEARRAQYSAEAILAQLHPGRAERVLGVVDLDLFVPQLNFVFGLADSSERRAVIALPRLRQTSYGLPDDEALYLERAVKEAVHELGHTFGLGHCRDRHCVMAFSNSLADTDYKGSGFCLKCQEHLGPQRNGEVSHAAEN